MKARTLTLTFLGLAALTLSSCNTFIGMGRDLRILGKGMENTGHGKTWHGNEYKKKSHGSTDQ